MPDSPTPDQVDEVRIEIDEVVRDSDFHIPLKVSYAETSGSTEYYNFDFSDAGNYNFWGSVLFCLYDDLNGNSVMDSGEMKDVVVIFVDKEDQHPKLGFDTNTCSYTNVAIYSDVTKLVN